MEWKLINCPITDFLLWCGIFVYGVKKSNVEIEIALIFELILVAVLMTVWFFRIVLSFEVTVFALADINFNAAVRASGNTFTEHLGAAIINLLLRRSFSQVLIL